MKGKLFLPAIVLAAAFAVTQPPLAHAHCDTLDGPVVTAARRALSTGDLTPVFKWIKKDREPELRAAFERALSVRSLSPQARELADTFFFETLVRIHRAGEGAPYNGLKSEAAEPAIVAADQALESASPESLVKAVTGDVAAGLLARFGVVLEARKHADESVEAGRAYVAAYVEYVHFVERLHAASAAGAAHQQETEDTHHDSTPE